MDDAAPWTTAPYVLCEHCDRETLVENAAGLPLIVGLEVPCVHCGAVLRVTEIEDIRKTRCVVIRFPEDAVLEDELTPVETPAIKLVKP